MARQKSKNYFSDSAQEHYSLDDDPFHDYDAADKFLQTLKTFKPQSMFEKKLVNGVLHRYGRRDELDDCLQELEQIQTP